jgi:hypothetical protein
LGDGKNPQKMRKSTLLQTISALPKTSILELEKWLASPIFNPREDLVRLFAHIAKNIEKSPDQLKKEQTWAIIFPKKPFQEAQMNHLMSFLLKEVRDYIAWLEWQSDPPTVQLHLARGLRKLGLEAQFARSWEEASAMLEKLPFRDEHYHYLSHLLHRERYEQQNLSRRTNEVPFEAIARHSEAAFRLNQLRLQCSLAAMKSVSGQRNAEMEAKNSENVANIIQNDLPAQIYESLLAALKNQEAESDFFKAKKLLLTNWSLFRENERRDIYLLAINFCIRKINGGKPVFMHEAFDLYRNGLENRSLFENGFLSRFTYKNAVTSGLFLKEYDWVRQFLDEYKPFLPARERHPAYQYNLAMYYFRLPDYDNAMNLLREADFGDDVMTNLDARSMLLRIYFEQNYFDALDSWLDSFQIYLRRHKEIGYQQENYANLLRFVRLLIKENPLSIVSKSRLRTEIEATKNVAERAWLLGQL